MRRFVITVVALMIIAPLFFLPLNTTEAASSLAPLTPHEVKVLVVSPSNLYFRGGGYLISDLASYGFSVTQQTSDYADAVDYRTDPKTANLNQYDVVILQGSYFGRPPTNVTIEELRHFTNYAGTLIVIGDALFVNETRKSSPYLWDDFFFSQPVQLLETRLGLVFLDYLRTLGATDWHNSGTFNLTSSLIPGLPSSLSYVKGSYPFSQYQMAIEPSVAEQIYDFTTQNGKKTLGASFYRNSTGAVGIYIQGAYIYAEQPGTNRINYFGLTETPKRRTLLASLIAYALNKDINTVVKPQPLANVRLDGVGKYFSETYLNGSLRYFDTIVDDYNIMPTIGFIDSLDFKPDYWRTVVPNTFAQVKSVYRDWEYSSTLRYYIDPRLMTKEQIETLIDTIRSSYSSLGVDLFSTVIAPNSRWNQTTLDAMASKSLYLLDTLDAPPNFWELKVNSSIIVHNSIQMLPEQVGTSLAEDFNQTSLSQDAIHSKYFTQRDKIALAILNGFVGFTYYVPNFRWNKVGTYSVQTVAKNLTSEIPDIMFVPLIEAGLYFGNHLAKVQNVVRDGPVIEFDVDASAVPNVVNIEKGMLWLRIDAGEPIQEVSINGNSWFYFDQHSIRLPSPDSSAHIRVVLGPSPTPRIAESRYKVVRASFDGTRFNVSITTIPNLNVTARLLIPQTGIFSKDNWSVFCLEEKPWNFNFTAQNRMLDFWAISDGFTSFEVGVFWLVDITYPRYDSSVTVSANFSGLELEITSVVMSYNLLGDWANASMTSQSQLWVATIPAMAYGTTVRYRLYAHASIDKWFATEVFSYDVIDDRPPEIGNVDWGPSNPYAGQPVRVSVPVSEPQNASGIKQVTLAYALGFTSPTLINMTNQNGTWAAEIPGQFGGANVNFRVNATDNAGNSKLTDMTSYTVFFAPIPIWLLITIAGMAVAAVVGVGLYFTKFRKQRLQSGTGEPKVKTKTPTKGV